MNFTPEKYLEWRQKGRTDLRWLCANILGYEDVTIPIHGPILNVLQKFKGGTEEVKAGSQANQFVVLPNSYKAHCQLWELERTPEAPHRNTLILYPRGHLKTSLVTFAHTIQWILNYPDVLIDLHTAIDQQAKQFIFEIKQHFTSNTLFRAFYPEYCPKQKGKTGKTEDFGNQEMFRVPNAKARKEPTISTFTVGSTIASGHYDVTVVDDLVDKENVRTPEQIQVVKQHFSMIDPLVQRYNKPLDWPADKVWHGMGWVNLTGTIYDFCLTQRNRILMADWTHKLISEVKVGDSVVGFELKNNTRWLRPSKVLACGKYSRKPVNIYKFESGREVVCTPQHRWWRGSRWSKEINSTEYAPLPTKMNGRKKGIARSLVMPTSQNFSRDAGWLAGIFDGEGCVSKRTRYPSAILQITQSDKNPEVVAQIRGSLEALGFGFKEKWWNPALKGNPKWHKRCVFEINGGWRERYRFLVEVAPSRRDKLIESLYGALQTQEDRLTAIEDAGEQDVYWFQTETGNYFAEGLASKNSDLHFSTLEAEREKPKEKQSWNVVCVSGAPNYPEGPTLWPQRWPIEQYRKIEEDPTKGPAVLASQYLMNPVPAKSGLVDSEDQISWIPRNDLDALLPRLTQNVTIDLAGMQPSTSKMADLDYTVINHHGFSRDGRLYINRLWRERFTDPMQVIDLMFHIRDIYPKVQNFRISKDHFARILLPFLTREMTKRGKWLPVTPIPIDTTVSKQQKIKGLKPWLQSRSIILANDISCKFAVINEIMRFPKYSHDDILDTIADAMTNEDGSLNMDVVGRPKTEQEVAAQESPLPVAMTWAMMQQQEKEEEGNYMVTGWN